MTGLVYAALASLLGALGILGWIVDSEPLKHVIPGAVSMKYSTAWCFLLSGALPALIHASSRSIISLFAAPIVGIMALSTFSRIDTLVAGDMGLLSTSPGVPSVATASCFALIAIAGIAYGLSGRKWRLAFTAVEVVGWVAIAGYILGVPAMHYYAEGWSTSMAIHTAAGFVLLGRSRSAL